MVSRSRLLPFFLLLLPLAAEEPFPEESDEPYPLPGGATYYTPADEPIFLVWGPGAARTLAEARGAVEAADGETAGARIRAILGDPFVEVDTAGDRPASLRDAALRVYAAMPEAVRKEHATRSGRAARREIDAALGRRDPTALTRVAFRYPELPLAETALATAADLFVDRGMTTMAAACLEALADRRAADRDTLVARIESLRTRAVSPSDLPDGERLVPLWEAPFEEPIVADRVRADRPQLRPGDVQPPDRPRLLRGRLWVRDGETLVSIDPATGDAHRIPLRDPDAPEIREAGEDPNVSMTFGVATLERREIPAAGGILAVPFRSTRKRYLRLANRACGLPFVGRPPNGVAGVDATSGEILWRHVLPKGFLVGPPLAVDDRILVPVVIEQFTIQVRVIDRAHGSLLWETAVCRDVKNGAAAVLARDGTGVVAETAYGHTARLSPLDGRLHWTVYHKRHPLIRTGLLPAVQNRWLAAPITWTPGPAVPAGGGIVTGSPATSILRKLDRSDGSVRWGIRTDGVGTRSLLGDDEGLWTVRDRVTRLDPETGETLWESARIGTPLGTGAVGARRIYIPTVDRLLIFDREDGTLAASLPFPEERLGGNLLILPDGTLVVTGLDAVRAYRLVSSE